MTEVVILAAGKGTRMRSKLPKVLHTLANKPFLQHVVDTSLKINAKKITIIVGHGAEQVKSTVFGEGISYVEQLEQLGTGHAVKQALPEISKDKPTLILYGDVPLISAETLDTLLSLVSPSSMGLLTFNFDNPTGYGRIVRNEHGAVESIVEQKDASSDQLEICEGNTGVMAVMGTHLHQWLPKLSNNNAQKEFYLTDIIEMAVNDGISVKATFAKSELEISGVNNRLQQAELERAYQKAEANRFMENGLTICDPSRFDVRGSISHGHDCVIDVNCILEGQVTLGNNVKVGPNCVIKNALIADDVEIKSNSVVEDTHIGERCVIGPFARLRPGTELASDAKIGNFVETKKAKVGQGSKINHLSYVGDAELGLNVNVGAGTITCNYDGVNKSKTLIGDNVFVGSNSALVAPVSLAKDTTVGAGSTITRDSDEAQLILSRAKQRNLDGWIRPKKKN